MYGSYLNPSAVDMVIPQPENSTLCFMLRNCNPSTMAVKYHDPELLTKDLATLVAEITKYNC